MARARMSSPDASHRNVSCIFCPGPGSLVVRADLRPSRGFAGTREVRRHVTAGTSATDPLPVPNLRADPALAFAACRTRPGVLVALVALVLIVGVLRPNFFAARRPCSSSSRAPRSSACWRWRWSSSWSSAISICRSDGCSISLRSSRPRRWSQASIRGSRRRHRHRLRRPGLGLINGVLAVSLRIPVIIITLGTLSAYRGLCLVVNESRAVVPTDKSSSFFALFDLKALRT